MKKIYVKPGINKHLTLSRYSPANLSIREGGTRGAIKNSISRRVKTRLKTIPRPTTKRLIRTLDPHREDEIHDGIQSLHKPQDAIRKAKNSYNQISKHVNRVKRAVNYVKRPRYSVQSLSAYKKIKSASSVQSVSNLGNVPRIKTLSSKYVPKNRFTSLSTIKTGIKKGLASPGAFMKMAANQLAHKLAAAAATVSAKVWLIAGAVAVVFFLLMSVTNSLGGSVSSAGSFFMTDEDNAKKYKETVDQRNAEFQAQIESYKHNGYDDVRIEYMNEEGTLHVNWVEIFAIVAVKFEQDLTFTTKQNAYIDMLFDQFNDIATDTGTYYVTVCSKTTDPETGEEEEECDSESRSRLIVKVYSYDMEDVFGKIGFDEEQREWARRLVTSGAIQEQFPELGGGYTGGTDPNPGSLTPEEMADLIHNLGGDIDKARKKLIETALTLEGKVGYFWGGKSPAGWNNNWGNLVMVTAPGNNTTGTLQPYGMDCSGFIDWAFKTAGLGNVFSAGGTSYQWSKTFSISEDELIPGDLFFKNIPGQGGVNHIGIFIGRDSNGSKLFIHCEGGTGVVISGYKGFKYPRRPLLFK